MTIGRPLTPGDTSGGPLRRRVTLRRQVTVACVLVMVALVVTTAAATVTALRGRAELRALLDDVGPMRTASTQLLASLIDQETGLRGYTVNGQDADLDPYTRGIAAQQRFSDAITGNPRVTAPITGHLGRLSTLMQSWRSEFAEPAIAAVRAGDRPAGQSLIGAPARLRFDEIRREAAALDRAIDDVRDAAIAGVERTNAILLIVLAAATVVVLAGSVGLLVMLQRLVIGPVLRLAGHVRTVAAGDYGHRIGTGGPPELAHLAQDIEGMRQRIAADLVEVQSARQRIEETNALLQETNQALERQAAELTRSNRDLEQFAYVASHDLQEPLRKVASFCQLLQRRYQGQLDERADQYINFAVEGAGRLQRLINDLLAFSRIGRVTTGFTDVDLARIVAAQADARSEQPAKITWSDLPVVRGEEPLLTTVFANLISNAVKFRRPDYPVRVHLDAHRDGDLWQFSCIDDGIGIGPEFADKVFVIFQRLHARDAYPGTGIGLSIVKKIVEYHGGRIWVDTEHTDGAAIRFTLPATVPAAPAPHAVTAG